MIVRISRALVSGRGIFLHFFQNDGDGLFELGIVAFAHGFGIHFDLNIGRDAVIFHFEFPG